MLWNCLTRTKLKAPAQICYFFLPSVKLNSISFKIHIKTDIRKCTFFVICAGTIVVIECKMFVEKKWNDHTIPQRLAASSKIHIFHNYWAHFDLSPNSLSWRNRAQSGNIVYTLHWVMTTVCNVAKSTF